MIRWRLAQIMLDKDMKPGELQRLTGLHRNTISKLRGMKQAPDRIDRDTLDKLCKALDCQVGDLAVYEKDD